MCNCKGWGIAFFQDAEITVVQHFCRVFDDCGHVDNTLEEAADQVASEYAATYALYCNPPYNELITEEKLDWLLAQAKSWKDRTHTSYLYYSIGENVGLL